MTPCEAHDKECVKTRLLSAGKVVFAENGYRDTTVADICKEAQANVAAVNYYFGSKEKLYAEVWKQSFDEMMRAWPPDGGLPETAPAADRLRALVRAHVFRMLVPGPVSIAGNIVLKEMMQPTEALAMIRNAAIEPFQRLACAVISELLGPGASERQILFCCLSILHQCLALGARKVIRGGIALTANLPLNDREFVTDLADHIYEFSLAGIQCLRQKNNQAAIASAGQLGRRL